MRYQGQAQPQMIKTAIITYIFFEQLLDIVQLFSVQKILKLKAVSIHVSLPLSNKKGHINLLPTQIYCPWFGFQLGV